ncbi:MULTISPECIES: hypothetical protein [unclassified Microcoleus]|uniref:hypothetical protein n=1 Tax=unclassified Microcoleus TaxID=2642155 RepID=UPI002FD62F5E
MKVKNVFTPRAIVLHSTIQRAERSQSHVNACTVDASYLDSPSKISYQFHSSPAQHNDFRF